MENFGSSVSDFVANCRRLFLYLFLFLFLIVDIDSIDSTDIDTDTVVLGVVEKDVDLCWRGGYAIHALER